MNKQLEYLIQHPEDNLYKKSQRIGINIILFISGLTIGIIMGGYII